MLSVITTVTHGISIAQGLAELHELNLIHKDLRPSKVLFTQSGHLVLADFGITAIVNKIMNTTQPSQLSSIINYKAPEQIDGATDANSVTDKADIWALGCIILHMLTGQHPLHNKTYAEVIRAVRQWFRPTRKFLVREGLPNTISHIGISRASVPVMFYCYASWSSAGNMQCYIVELIQMGHFSGATRDSTTFL